MSEKLGYIFWGFVTAGFQFGIVIFIRYFWGFSEVGHYITAQLIIAALVPLLSLDYHRRVDFLGDSSKAVFGYRRQVAIVIMTGTMGLFLVALYDPAYTPQIFSAVSATIFILTHTFVKNNLSKYSLYYLDIIRWVLCYLCLFGVLYFEIDLTLSVFGYLLAVSNLAFLCAVPVLVSRFNLLKIEIESGSSLAGEIKKSIGFLPYSLSGFLMTNIDRIFISTSLGLAELGIYAWIQNLAAPLKVITNNVTLLYSRLKFSSVSFNLHKEVRQQMIIMSVFALLFYFVGFVILKQWPVGVDSSLMILGFLILANLIRGGKQYAVVNNYENLKLRKPLADLVITIFATIVLLPALQSIYGLSGVAIFTLFLSLGTVFIWRYL